MNTTANPAEALERQTGNQARDLARAITRIGELDCTRTLPGRLVWYERHCCKCGDQISPGWISFTSCAGEFCGPCWDPERWPTETERDGDGFA
jgi:hypothetical protein